MTITIYLKLNCIDKCLLIELVNVCFENFLLPILSILLRENIIIQQKSDQQSPCFPVAGSTRHFLIELANCLAQYYIFDNRNSILIHTGRIGRVVGSEALSRFLYVGVQRQTSSIFLPVVQRRSYQTPLSCYRFETQIFYRHFTIWVRVKSILYIFLSIILKSSLILVMLTINQVTLFGINLCFCLNQLDLNFIKLPNYYLVYSKKSSKFIFEILLFLICSCIFIYPKRLRVRL